MVGHLSDPVLLKDSCRNCRLGLINECRKHSRECTAGKRATEFETAGHADKNRKHNRACTASKTVV